MKTLKLEWRTIGRAPVGGFTLVELLVVTVVIGILCSLLLPALAQARSHAQNAACRSNLKQHAVSWHLYASDNNDAAAPNNSFYSVSQPNSTNTPFQSESGPSWAPGIAPLDTTTANLQQGLLFPYNQAAAIYHCPADRSSVSNYPGLPRTRSYCMNISLNCDDASGAFRKLSQITAPSPSSLFVLIDTQESDIWDGTFGIFSSDSVYANDWLDLPADRHNQGANLTLADGHVEHWRWKAPKIFTTRWEPAYSASDLADLQRLQSAAKDGMD